jgi:hypothetical protein
MSPRVRKDSVHPRLQSGGTMRPLNFTVRRRELRIVKFKTVVLYAFVILLAPAFLLERYLEDTGLVDALGSWYTLCVAIVGSALAAALIALVLVRTRQ